MIAFNGPSGSVWELYYDGEQYIFALLDDCVMKQNKKLGRHAYNILSNSECYFEEGSAMSMDSKRIA